MEDDLPTEYDVIVVGTGIDFYQKEHYYLIDNYWVKKINYIFENHGYFLFFFFVKLERYYFSILTGMTESIVAAAASRIGKKVLHLDR